MAMAGAARANIKSEPVAGYWVPYLKLVNSQSINSIDKNRKPLIVATTLSISQFVQKEKNKLEMVQRQLGLLERQPSGTAVDFSLAVPVVGPDIVDTADKQSGRQKKDIADPSNTDDPNVVAYLAEAHLPISLAEQTREFLAEQQKVFEVRAKEADALETLIQRAIGTLQSAGCTLSASEIRAGIEASLNGSGNSSGEVFDAKSAMESGLPSDGAWHMVGGIFAKEFSSDPVAARGAASYAETYRDMYNTNNLQDAKFGNDAFGKAQVQVWGGGNKGETASKGNDSGVEGIKKGATPDGVDNVSPANGDKGSTAAFMVNSMTPEQYEALKRSTGLTQEQVSEAIQSMKQSVSPSVQLSGPKPPAGM